MNAPPSRQRAIVSLPIRTVGGDSRNRQGHHELRQGNHRNNVRPIVVSALGPQVSRAGHPDAMQRRVYSGIDLGSILSSTLSSRARRVSASRTSRSRRRCPAGDRIVAGGDDVPGHFFVPMKRHVADELKTGLCWRVGGSGIGRPTVRRGTNSSVGDFSVSSVFLCT
jgi:hypothetical protein